MKQETLKVGINELEANKYKEDVKQKIVAYNEALAYTSEFITVKDKVLFAESMVSYFKSEFNKQTESEFSPLYIEAKKYEMIGFELHKLESLELRYNSLDVQIDVETLEAINTPNFDIVLTTDESIKRYKAVKKVIESLEGLKEFHLTVYPALAQQVLNNTARYSFTTNKLEVNLSWCNGFNY